MSSLASKSTISYETYTTLSKFCYFSVSLQLHIGWINWKSINIEAIQQCDRLHCWISWNSSNGSYRVMHVQCISFLGLDCTFIRINSLLHTNLQTFWFSALLLRLNCSNHGHQCQWHYNLYCWHRQLHGALVAMFSVHEINTQHRHQFLLKTATTITENRLVTGFGIKIRPYPGIIPGANPEGYTE